MTPHRRQRAQAAREIDLGPVAALVVEAHQAAPACAVGAAIHRQGWRHGWGSAGRLWTRPAAEEAPLAQLDQLYDLASLTKPVVALVLARLERARVVSRREILGEVVADLAATASANVSLDLLSAHRAGLEAHREFFIKAVGARQPTAEQIVVEAAEARRPGCEGEAPKQGFAPVYSDLGYILVGHALERRTGRSLDALVEAEIAGPLGLRLGSVDRLGGDGTIVPTEEVAWRGGVLRGVVHDENAWVLAGKGTAGHAGLFGDVAAVVGLGVAIVDGLNGERGWLGPADLAPLVRPRPGGSHAAGFDRRSGQAPTSGRHFGSETFGHLGFTGTSIWIDPDERLVGVVLTNRVHPSREHIAIRAARPAAYDMLFEKMVAS